MQTKRNRKTIETCLLGLERITKEYKGIQAALDLEAPT